MPRLDFNDFEVARTLILKPVPDTQWNVDRLVFMEHDLLFTASDKRCANYNHPMLGTVVMQL